MPLKDEAGFSNGLFQPSVLMAFEGFEHRFDGAPGRILRTAPKGEKMHSNDTQAPLIEIVVWHLEKFVPYVRNPRKNDSAVDRMCGSIREFGFKIPVLARSDGTVVDGHLRLKAAGKIESWPGGDITGIPVILCDEWTEPQVKAFRLMVNRSVTWAEWDDELLALELKELSELDFNLDLTGFSSGEIDELLAVPDEEQANQAPPLPAVAISRLDDLWLCGSHRVLCGDATKQESVKRLLDGRAPLLLVSDPPYGILLDSEWRDRAGLNGGDLKHAGRRTSADKEKARRDTSRHAEPSYMKHRTEGHTETTISGDTRADWSDAFALVPSLEVGYVWHASMFTREVLDGLLRIGFLHHQQIIWDKGRTVLTRTLYWFQHEPCWFVRKKNAPWYGKAGENSTIWASPSPKFIMGGSDEEKYDHPTQKPIELMRRPILDHLRRGELVYDPFLGSGTTLAAAQLTERVCCGMDLDPKYCDVLVQRWQTLSGKQATLEGDGRTFAEVAEERRRAAV